MFDSDPRYFSQYFEPVFQVVSRFLPKQSENPQLPFFRFVLWKTYFNLWKTLVHPVESLWKSCGNGGENFGQG